MLRDAAAVSAALQKREMAVAQREMKAKTAQTEADAMAGEGCLGFVCFFVCFCFVFDCVVLLLRREK